MSRRAPARSTLGAMKWGMVLAGIWLLACRGEGAGDAAPSEGCTPACADGLACRDGACTAPAVACATNTDCAGDRTCDRTRSVCVPWGDGASDATCLGAPSPGTFFPSVQCAWAGPGAGDAFPDHVNVLATPMVAAFDRGGAPSLVFTSYNATDYGPFACNGASAKAFGVIRVIGPAKAAYSGVITPVIAMLLSTVFEHYVWSALAAAGSLLVLGGLVIALRARRPAR